MKTNRLLRCLNVLFIGTAVPTLVAQGPFANSTDTIPASYGGRKFVLSHDYPAQSPPNPASPWKQHDFRTAPVAYMRAVFDYCLAGQEDVDWVVQDNAVRKWYHAPGLVGGANGREFVRGLTRERTSRPRELHAQQASSVQNWGTGFYNAVGGFTIGQVWADPGSPDPSKAHFAEGTVAFKILFTRALVAEVPYLSRTLRWRANVNRNGQPIFVKLLQMDIAVKDSRAETGWVFGTFVYQDDGGTGSPWTRMVPACLAWGNDPTLGAAAYAGGERPQQSWIAPELLAGPKKLPHFGWLDRADGPVDNPRSACMSCHMTAQWPMGDMLPAASASPAVTMTFYRNLKYPTPFTVGRTSLDFSLQVAMGMRNFPGTLAGAGILAATDAMPSFNMREGSVEAAEEAATVGAGPDDPADAAEGHADAGGERKSGASGGAPAAAEAAGLPWAWILGGLVFVALAVFLASRKKA
ncbi:MAG TPA: hypothetical protein VFZ65_01415 [Planctomycetota bacterium]|nr:hypothetical protein [Planctomycetota bacterium]